MSICTLCSSNVLQCHQGYASIWAVAQAFGCTAEFALWDTATLSEAQCLYAPHALCLVMAQPCILGRREGTRRQVVDSRNKVEMEGRT